MALQWQLRWAHFFWVSTRFVLHFVSQNSLGIPESIAGLLSGVPQPRPPGTSLREPPRARRRTCGPQELRPRSGSDLFQPVLVMKSTQHGFATHSVARRKLVSMLGVGRGWMKWCRDTRSQAHMNSAMVLMQYPAVENLLEMPLSQRDEEIQALPADGSDQAFASGIRWGDRKGVRNMRTPMAATALSNSWEKLLSRSWMRKRNG